MGENVLMINDSLSNIQRKEDIVLTEIKKKVCALLNTNGGKLVLTAHDATPDNKLDYGKVIRLVEQYFGRIMGFYEVHRRFHVLEKGYNTITLGIQALPILCTLNTYLFLPTNTKEEMCLISCKEQFALRQILFNCCISENFEHEVPEQFFSGRNCGFCESKTVQFKLVKTERTKQIDFADCVINNKFTNIISSFANAAGGNIFYGVNDDGFVEGELLSDSELCKTTEKLEKAVEEMIWQDKSKKVERGKEWDIKFVPVKDCDNETIPSTFVMVVTVNPYIGGVFTQEPESYYLENGEVKKMPFDIWRQNTYCKVATPVPEMERRNWSSEKNRRSYMKITQRLKNLRQLGRWEEIKNFVSALNEHKLPVDTELACLFQLIAVDYRQGDYEGAENFLKEFRKDMESAEDKSVFAVQERYSSSAIERSRGDYQEAWKIIDDGLKLAHHAPAGLIPASVYVNAASIISSSVGRESCFDDSKTKMHEDVEKGISFCHHALQHLLYIEDEFEIAREDLKQRIYITLASLHLKLADPELSFNTGHDHETSKAMLLLKESDESLTNLKGTERLMFNSCLLSLEKSYLNFQKYILEPTTDKQIEYLDESARCVEEAREPADDKGFEEIKMLCAERSQKINASKNEEKDKLKALKTFVDELLS